MILPVEEGASGSPLEDFLASAEVTPSMPEEPAPGVVDEAAVEEALKACETFFSPGGTLADHAAAAERTYEFRPQQLTMAQAIVKALAAGRNLCVEAPTGVGKSFAYLYPLILRSRTASRPAVISTETIHLQEQLINRDIPFLQQITDIPFKAALAKGRHNYLCRRRLALLSGEERDRLLPTASLVCDLDALNRWQDQTESGERDEITFNMDPAVWPLVASEGLSCMGPKCPYYRSCFYYKARKAWETADLIVANHALFFTDLAMRCSGGSAGTLLPNYGAVMIDEAHTLEHNAAEYLGLHLSRGVVVGTLNRLYNPDSARGLLMRQQGEAIPALRGAVAAARSEAAGFFAAYETMLDERHETALRLREAEPETPPFLTALAALSKQLISVVESLDDEKESSFKTELSGQLDYCREFQDSVAAFVWQELPESVYYVENDRNSVSLHASPLNVAELLQKYLFHQDFPVLLCSATLTVRQDFHYFLGRTGFGNGETLRLDTPFSPEQAHFYLPSDMPDPVADLAEFQQAVNREVPRFLQVSQGRAFVLFTSYRMLRDTAEELRSVCAAEGWPLLVQGEALTRSAMLREFRQRPSVLLGTDSFWTGVDVPGEALSCVIITKLPFPSPGHPLIAAREEKIKSEGKSPFFEYDLPEAVLKFRQGVGRLIRSRSDVGIIVLLDRRVVTRKYGQLFLDSIPYRLDVVK